MGNLSINFDSGEFACDCGCGRSLMNKKFIDKLQNFRTVMAMPISILEGYKCKGIELKNSDEDSKSKKDKKSKKTDSINTTGQVAVVKIKSADLFKAVNVAMSIGFTGVGMKNKDGVVQLHLDDIQESVGNQPRPYIWSY